MQARTPTKGLLRSDFSTAQGKALEDLICEIFAKVPGVEVAGRNVSNVAGTEEVDLMFWNRRLSEGFYHIETSFLVECNNWASRVPGNVIAVFSNILQQRACRDGILIACSGITGTPGRLTQAYSAIASSLAQGRRIIVINRKELESFSHTDHIVEMLKVKILQLTSLSTLG